MAATTSQNSYPYSTTYITTSSLPTVTSKPNNLLDRYNNIRLIDFGLSNQFTALNPKLSTACGSPTTAAPEMIKGQLYTRAADIWSIGIMLFALVTPANYPLPTTTCKNCFTKLCTPTFSNRLDTNPDSRITLDKIKEHHWFSQTQ
jgi:serine/threonine protein kinase